MSLPFLPVGTRAFFFSAHITKYTGTHNKDRTKIRGTTHKVAYSRPRCKIRTGTPKIHIPWCVCWVVGSTYCTSVFLLIRKREGHRMNTRGTPSLVPPPATETSDFFFYVMQIFWRWRKTLLSLPSGSFELAAIILRRPRLVNKICPDKEKRNLSDYSGQTGTVCDNSFYSKRCKVCYNQF